MSGAPIFRKILRRAGPPHWVLPDASIDMWFTRDLYFGASPRNLSVSRASVGYAEDEKGNWRQFENDAARIGSNGLLVEDGCTNVVLWCRDLTNAAWVATKIRTKKDQTGFDGTPYSATSITATSENGTILQSIGDHEVVPRQHSAFVKRLSGSGAIQMTMDGGTSWANVTAANEWTRVNMPAQTIGHPVVGFRLLTKADSIAVDCVQNEKLTSGIYGLYANSSPIITNSTSADRPADIVSIKPTPNISSAAFSMYCDGAFLGQSSAPTVFPYLFNAVGKNPLDDVVGFGTRNDIASWPGFGVRISGSGKNAAIPPGSPSIRERFAVAGAFSTIRSQTAANGYLGTPSGSNPLLNPIVSVGFGLPAHFQLPPFFYFGRVALWLSTTLTDDTLVTITATSRG